MTNFPTCDPAIREVLRSKLSIVHNGDDAVIVDELKVSRGSSRVDVAVINGRIEGYEIKSDRDTLSRLANQAEHFSRIADRMTLVVGDKHYDCAVQLIPIWWSILRVTQSTDGTLKLKSARRGQLNRSKCIRSLAEILERDELVALLVAHELDRGCRSFDHRSLVAKAVSCIKHRDIEAFVKKILKVRARLAHRYGDTAFGRNAIICGAPFG